MQLFIILKYIRCRKKPYCLQFPHFRSRSSNVKNRQTQPKQNIKYSFLNVDFNLWLKTKIFLVRCFVVVIFSQTTVNRNKKQRMWTNFFSRLCTVLS